MIAAFLVICLLNLASARRFKFAVVSAMVIIVAGSTVVMRIASATLILISRTTPKIHKSTRPPRRGKDEERSAAS